MSWTLLAELLTKSSVIVAAGLALSALIAFRPARDRVDVLRATVCLVVALPVFLAIGPRLPLAWLADAAEPVAASAATPQVLTLNFDPVADLALSATAPPALSWPVVFFILYALGVAALVGWLALGLSTLQRWTQEGEVVRCPAWRDTLSSMGAGRTRLVQSNQARSPLSWGMPPGVVLLPVDTVAHAEMASAVLAHELAHIRRGDWLFLLISRLALALFWFNPVVWLAHRQLVILTEEAADAAAVASVDRRAYARTLVDLADETRQPAALAMAGHPKTLARRIAHIMKTPRKSPARPLAMTLAIGALVAVATPLAAIELVPRPQAPPAPPAVATPLLAHTPVASTPPAVVALSAPPAPPTPQAASTRYIIRRDGQTRTYSSLEEMDGETRREFEQERAAIKPAPRQPTALLAPEPAAPLAARVPPSPPVYLAVVAPPAARVPTAPRVSSAARVPPAPPAAPVPTAGARYIFSRDGSTRTYSSLDEMTPEVRETFSEYERQMERHRLGMEEHERNMAEHTRRISGSARHQSPAG